MYVVTIGNGRRAAPEGELRRRTGPWHKAGNASLPSPRKYWPFVGGEAGTRGTHGSRPPERAEAGHPARYGAARTSNVYAAAEAAETGRPCRYRQPRHAEKQNQTGGVAARRRDERKEQKVAEARTT
ncbi:hypothetical protein HPB47_000505 [Ixodes persulcatus]|uniref:Uncharacterized protein n=1 Tax=Ixodes persulcatus TaxID=34615 RepID=A0AC60PRR0_IXOPE|nr:hypothetical protein HPB47_000505 [Ixodes persulcatus]